MNSDPSNLLRSIIGSIRDGLLAFDARDKIGYFNREFAELWQIPSELMESGDGQAVLDHLHEQLLSETGLPGTRLADKPTQAQEDIIPLKDDRVIQCLFQPLCSADDVEGRVWRFTDITPQMRARADRLEYEFRLERQNEAISELSRRKAGQGVDLESALQEICEAASVTLDLERVSVWLYPKTGETPQCANRYLRARDQHSQEKRGQDAALLVYFRTLADERVCGVNDTRTDPRTQKFWERYLAPHGISSQIIAPIRHDGRVLGIILYEHAGAARRWFPDEQQFAASMADIAALALEAEDRRRAERQLQAAFDFQQLILDTAATAVYTTDGDGHITGVNEALCSIMGYTLEEVQGKHFTCLGTGRCENDCPHVANVLQDPVNQHHCTVCTKAGEPLEVIKNITPVRDAEGTLTQVLVSFVDVTELVRARHQTEEALRQAESARDEALAAKERVEGMAAELHQVNLQVEQAKRNAEDASRAKSQFLTNISHELRTPMNAVIGMTELTLETKLTSEQRDNLQTVHQSSKLLLGLLKNVLDLSEVEAGQMQLEIADFSLRPTLASALTPLVHQAAAKGLDMSISIADDAPEALEGDPLRFKQILVNLVGNAIKFTPQGCIDFKLVVESTSETEVSFHCSVTDTGIGIPEDRVDAIFEPFTQADGSMTRKYEGSGLGTTISKQLVELMGGRIWVESEEGVGTTFGFVVPFALQMLSEESPGLVVTLPDSPEIPTPPRPAEVIDSSGVVTLSNLRILLAEDNRINQKLAVRLLERQGWQVEVAANGLEVLERVERETFDLILMDVFMPEMDGLQTAQRIREMERSDGKHIPIVALTAHATSGDRVQCLRAGMDGYLTKPINRKELLTTIAALFQAAADPVEESRPAEKSEPTEPVDTAELFELLDGDTEAIVEIAGAFLEDLPKSMAIMREAHAQGDCDTLLRKAHSLKGAAGSMAALPLHRLAGEMQSLGEGGGLTRAGELLGRMEDEAVRVQSALSRLIQAENAAGIQKPSSSDAA